MAKTLCIDFDDTIRGRDELPIVNARKVMRALHRGGHRVLVASARFSPLYGELNIHRMGMVREWLETHSIPVSQVCRFLPRADVYIDDLAYRFETNWETELPAILAVLLPGAAHSSDAVDKQVNVALDLVWQDDMPTPGAVDALGELTSRNIRVAVSVGASLDLPPDSMEAPSTRSLRDAMKDSGLRVERLDADKISSSMYISAQGLRFKGDWMETAAELTAMWKPRKSAP